MLATLLLPALLLADAPARPASASVAPVVVAKPALKDVRYAFGKEAEGALTAAARETLAASKYFDEVREKDGAVVLALEVRSSRSEVLDLREFESKPSRVHVDATITWRWSLAGEIVDVGQFEGRGDSQVERIVPDEPRMGGPRILPDDTPRRGDFTAAWGDLLTQAVRAAVASAYDSDAFPP